MLKRHLLLYLTLLVSFFCPYLAIKSLGSAGSNLKFVGRRLVGFFYIQYVFISVFNWTVADPRYSLLLNIQWISIGAETVWTTPLRDYNIPRVSECLSLRLRVGSHRPLSRKRVCLPPEPKGGGEGQYSLAGEVGNNSDDWRKNLTLCILSGTNTTCIILQECAELPVRGEPVLHGLGLRVGGGQPDPLQPHHPCRDCRQNCQQNSGEGFCGRQQIRVLSTQKESHRPPPHRLKK